MPLIKDGDTVEARRPLTQSQRQIAAGERFRVIQRCDGSHFLCLQDRYGVKLYLRRLDFQRVEA